MTRGSRLALEEQFEILSGSGPPDNTKDHFHDDIKLQKKAVVPPKLKAFSARVANVFCPPDLGGVGEFLLREVREAPVRRAAVDAHLIWLCLQTMHILSSWG